MFDRIASATVQVTPSASSGSGFRFLTPDVIVTNQPALTRWRQRACDRSLCE